MTAGSRYSSVQDAVGVIRGTAVVVRTGCDGGCHDSFAARGRFPIRATDLAASSHVDRDGGGADDCALHPVSWRWVPPVYSPVVPRTLVGGIAAACGSQGAPIENAVEELCTRYGACDALLTNSGTSALILAIRALLSSGGTIAYPGYSCIDL